MGMEKRKDKGGIMNNLFEAQAKADVEKFRHDLFMDKLEFIRSAQPSQLVLILEAVQARVEAIYNALQPPERMDEERASDLIYNSISHVEDAASSIRVAVREGNLP
jgi:hypothetical protein